MQRSRIDLSRRFARINKDLEKQLIQVKELSEKTLEQERRAKEEEVVRRLLEADNARKTRELEDARKLQLSMLLFNGRQEMFDYPRVQALFKKVACKAPEEIIAHIYDAVEDWRDGCELADDMTFVVLRVKG